MIRARVLVLMIGVALSACSSPRADVYRAKDGTVSTRVSGDAGPLTVGVTDTGATHLGTRIGPFSIGAGF